MKPTKDRNTSIYDQKLDRLLIRDRQLKPVPPRNNLSHALPGTYGGRRSGAEEFRFPDAATFLKYLQKRPYSTKDEAFNTKLSSSLRHFRQLRLISLQDIARVLNLGLTEMASLKELESNEHLPWTCDPALVARICQLYRIPLSRLVQLIKCSLLIAGVSEQLPKTGGPKVLASGWTFLLADVRAVELWLDNVRTFWLTLPDNEEMLDMPSERISVELRQDVSNTNDAKLGQSRTRRRRSAAGNNLRFE